MKNPQQNNENPQDIILGSPETSKDPKIKAQFENLRRFFGKAYALAILVMLSTSCSKETPVDVISNQAPQNKTFNTEVVDADGDGKKNDLKLTYIATDDKAVTSKKVLLTANEYSKTIDFGTATEKMIKNLENADYAAEFVAKDEQGLADSDTKNFKVEILQP